MVFFFFFFFDDDDLQSFFVYLFGSGARPQVNAVGWISSRERRPSRSPGLRIRGRRGVVGLEAFSLLSPLAPALEFQRFRATALLPGKMRTFRPGARILVSRAWHPRSLAPRQRRERDDGRLRGPRGRRGPKRAPSLVTEFSESVRFGLCLCVEDKRLNQPCEQSSPSGWLAGCRLLSSP